MRNELIVELRVMGFECTPEEITDILELNPSSTWVIGEAISKTGKGSAKHQENGWAFKVEVSENANSLEFPELFDRLYKTISARKENFLLLPANITVHLACCAYVREIAPVFSMSEVFIQFLSQIKASIDLDLYDLRA